MTMIRPGKSEFKRLCAGENRVPIYAEMLADLQTPVSVYWKLANHSKNSFLLESVTGGERLSRYSFIGADAKVTIKTKGRTVFVNNKVQEMNAHETPLDVIRKHIGAQPYTRIEGLPRFTGGAVGTLSYDLVRFFEKIPTDTDDDLECPDVSMLLCDRMIAFDHAKSRILVIAHASNEQEYDEACHTILETIEHLKRPLPSLPTAEKSNPNFQSNMSRDAFESAVRKAIQYIEEGDVVQVVISQRFSTEANAHPLMIYRALRSLNPSPYMYLLRFGDMDIIGASPEVLVTYEEGRVRVRPIAGTRHRGKTEEEDQKIEQELINDEKERAEHLMLVDLGRNDVGRIAKPGTVKMNEFMVVERYSHVMHIVSDVTGIVRDDLDSFNVFQACFPAGTVSGAPKVRAMEIIEELEPTRRGTYAGAVGYFGFNGDMDMAIAIRTILLKNGRAHIQAGAGIVFDSIPENEWQECHNKAKAVIDAVTITETGQIL